MMKCSYGAKAKLLVNAVFLGKRSKEYNAYSMLEGGSLVFAMLGP